MGSSRSPLYWCDAAAVPGRGHRSCPRGRAAAGAVDSAHGFALLCRRSAAAGHPPGRGSHRAARRGAHHLRRADRAPALPVQGRPEEGPRGLPLRRRGAPRPVPRQRRALHHAPGGRGRAVCRVAPGRAGPDGRAHARRDGGLRHRKSRADRALRRADRRGRRRPDQARSPAVQHARGGAGRVLPQDAAGDVARRARHPDQARRPAAQHAHHGGDGTGQTPAHRRRDTRHLRPHRPPPGAGPHLPRAAGTRLPIRPPLAPRHRRGGTAARARPPA